MCGCYFQKQANSFLRKWLNVKQITVVKNNWSGNENVQLSSSSQIRSLFIVYSAHSWDSICTTKNLTHLFTTRQSFSVLKERIFTYCDERAGHWPTPFTIKITPLATCLFQKAMRMIKKKILSLFQWVCIKQRKLLSVIFFVKMNNYFLPLKLKKKHHLGLIERSHQPGFFSSLGAVVWLKATAHTDHGTRLSASESQCHCLQGE